MSVPAAIEAVFNKFAVEFGISRVHPLSEFATLAGATQASIMQDGDGKVQVLFPADSILDVDALCRLTGRELKPARPEDVGRLCAKFGLDHITAVPGALGLPLVVDQRLLDITELQLDSGDSEQVISLSAAQFRQVIDEARVGDIAINQAQLHQSNLDDTEDLEQITTAVANFTQLRIRQRLEDTLDFPPLPDTAQRIIKLRVDPEADIQDLTDIVETDPALAAQVVSWAASPYYAAPGKIKSVHDAIVRVLGFDLVLNLALGLALGKTLNLPGDHAKGFTPYWHQAVYGAAAMEALVGAIPPRERPTMGMAYLSGLLHNFGYLVLAEVFPPYFSNICRYQEANPYANHCHIERHLLGVTREQLGAWLMRSWQMPEEVSVALRFQNEPDYSGEEHAYANLLYIAMRLLRKHRIGDAALEPIAEELFQRVHLDRDKAEEAIQRVVESAAELEGMATSLAA